MPRTGSFLDISDLARGDLIKRFVRVRGLPERAFPRMVRFWRFALAEAIIAGADPGPSRPSQPKRVRSHALFLLSAAPFVDMADAYT